MKFSIFKDINLLLFLGKALNEAFSILFNAFIKNFYQNFVHSVQILILDIYCVQILTFFQNNDNDF